MDDFATGLVGAATFSIAAVAIVGTWGAAAPVSAALVAGTWGELAAAGAIAGAVSGAMGAALGGANVLESAAMGAAIGAVSGGITGSISGAAGRQLAGVIMAAAAGGAAYATGGLEGLAHFGVGMAGALVGAYTVNWLLDPPPIEYSCKARVIQGNDNLIGSDKGAFSDVAGKIEKGTAAMEPKQWGLTKAKLRPYVLDISATLEDGTSLFSRVTDRIDAEGYSTLLKKYPDRLYIEVPGQTDLGVVNVILRQPRTLPRPVGCQ